MATRNLYKPTTLERLADDNANSQSELGESRRQSSVLLVSNYSPLTNSFSTGRQLGANEPVDESQVENRRRRRRRSSSFGEYVAHAFALGSKTNFLFGCLLLLNLLMSATNTIFLSLLVKSVQLSDLSLLASSGQRALEWNTQLDALELRLAAMGTNSTLSVQSIESFEGRPLIIGPTRATSIYNQQKQQRPILISATRPEAGESGRANQMTIGATGEPLEILVNNLVWDQVTNQHLETMSGEPKKNKQQQQARVHKAQQRRLLELDGGQKLIALPSSSQLELFPAKASALLVRKELDAQQSELSGTLEADLDVQSQRHGDLLCESRQTLRLVSRSGRLSLIGGQSLKLEAASRLQLDAKRLHLAEGIEFLDDDDDDIKESSLSSGESNQLNAFQLALVDNQLLAI